MATEKPLFTSVVENRFMTGFLYRTIFTFASFFWVSLLSFLLNLSLSIAKHIKRPKDDHETEENDSNFSGFHPPETDQGHLRSDFRCFESDGAGESKILKLSSKFQSPESRDSMADIAGAKELLLRRNCLTASTSKYQFMAGKDVSGFIEEPQAVSFSVRELFLDSSDQSFINKSANLGPGFSFFDVEAVVEPGVQGEGQNSDQFSCPYSSCRENSQFSGDEDFEAQNAIFSGTDISDKEKAEEENTLNSERDLIREQEEKVLCCEQQILGSGDGDWELVEKASLDDETELLEENQPSLPHSAEILDNYADELINGSQKFCSIGDQMESAETIKRDQSQGEVTADDELIKLEPVLQSSVYIYADNITGKDDEEMDGLTDQEIFKSHQNIEDRTGEEISSYKDLNDQEESSSCQQNVEDQAAQKKFWESDVDDDEHENDILLEHQNLVKQMKMEIRNARIKGLPTISEESETPKMVEDLKPLKFDQKFEYKDIMEEIQRFYKSYVEKMRKLDILNYQTLHAISFLQLKDSELFISDQKSFLSPSKGFLLPSFWATKLRRIHIDPARKSITEMNRDLESVYVGQLCLSWEILSWQRQKLKQLREYDSKGHHSYDQVAGQFQQFQVLMHRFVEDEPFQGPRIQNYVKNRLILRSLLQVPTLKNDYSKDKETCKGDGDSISTMSLAKIIEESMQAFWDFLRLDKAEAANGTSSADPADSDLLIHVRTTLQKKERKLKEILRSKSCLVKKFQKQEEGRVDPPLFVCRVELKLVGRVLKLPRLTRDHLEWCQKKLNNINFVGRKVEVENSFVLFPC